MKHLIYSDSTLSDKPILLNCASVDRYFMELRSRPEEPAGTRHWYLRAELRRNYQPDAREHLPDCIVLDTAFGEEETDRKFRKLIAFLNSSDHVLDLSKSSWGLIEQPKLGRAVKWVIAFGIFMCSIMLMIKYC